VPNGVGRRGEGGAFQPIRYAGFPGGRAARRVFSCAVFAPTLAASIAALTVAALVGRAVLLHPGAAAVGFNPASDFQIMTWSLAWWPWAISHGVNPLHTSLLWPPHGFSTLWMTSIPAPALIGLPLTLTAGPLVAFNVLSLAAVALAAASAYLLCRELSGHARASMVGALAFALSPYMLGHTLSQHLDLTFVFPLPLLALLALRFYRGKTAPVRFVAGFAALLLLLLGSSFELFLDLSFLIGLGALVTLLAGRGQRALIRVFAFIGVAYAASLPVLVPVALLTLTGAHAPLHNNPADHSIDLLNLVVPTPTLLAGSFGPAPSLSAHFVSNIGEKDGYLGLPLLLTALLAARARWRCGGWIGAFLLLAALLLSLGPLLTVDGDALLTLPFATARLPVLRDALPARISIFTMLAATCLATLWLAQPGRQWLRAAVALLIVLSLLPNPRPPRRLPSAWSVSDTLAWSTRPLPSGFVDSASWQRYIRPNSTVLVLPTGDHSAASYWQTKAGMRFKLAIPATPFIPPQVAAEPTIRALASNNLAALSNPALAAARLRTYLITNQIAAVVLTPTIGNHWTRIVAAATRTKPALLAGSRIYRVPTGLRPLPAGGAPVFARDPEAHSEQTAGQKTAEGAVAWLHYDGHRAHVSLMVGTSRHPLTLSSARADAYTLTATAGEDGRLAVAFSEWQAGNTQLRIATRTNGRWHLTTLENSPQPIASPRVVITRNGTTIASWIDETSPTRTIRTATLVPNGAWTHPASLENADGLDTLAIAASGTDSAVLAWHDSIANDRRIRATTYRNGRWGPVQTLATSHASLGRVTITGPNAQAVQWRHGNPNSPHSRLFTATRNGTTWRPPTPLRAGHRRPNRVRPLHRTTTRSVA
jgi:hypothetical protein